MQFKVPQFIEMESKIIGDLTFKQAIYIGGTAGIAYVLFKTLPAFLALPIIGIVALFGWALAFYPKQKFGKPFIEITESAFKYIAKDRLYTWKRSVPKSKQRVEEGEVREPLLSIPKVSSGKLSNISKDLEVGPSVEATVEEL